jgi:hypothetical protein
MIQADLACEKETGEYTLLTEEGLFNLSNSMIELFLLKHTLIVSQPGVFYLTMFPTNIQLCCLSVNKFMFIVANDQVLAVVVTHVRRYLLVM